VGVGVGVQGKAGEAETRSWNFVFDGVLDAGTSQAEVFDEVSNLVESVLEVCSRKLPRPLLAS
jgi:hypothetical protein